MTDRTKSRRTMKGLLPQVVGHGGEANDEPKPKIYTDYKRKEPKIYTDYSKPKPDESRLVILPKPHCIHYPSCPVVIEQANVQDTETASITQSETRKEIAKEIFARLEDNLFYENNRTDIEISFTTKGYEEFKAKYLGNLPE